MSKINDVILDVTNNILDNITCFDISNTNLDDHDLTKQAFEQLRNITTSISVG